MPLVSVIIPTYQRRASVEQMLRALRHQSMSPHDYEVIVSIDGSTDGTWEMVEALATPYSLRGLWRPNGGRAGACNAGIQAAVGDVIVLLDDDMEASPELLAAHARAHNTRERLGVMGAVPIAYDTNSPPIVRYMGARFNAHLQKLARPGHELHLRDFYTGNFSSRREVLQGVGLFDETFRIYGNEDIELSVRLRQGGVDLVYVPDAVARQHYTKDLAAVARDHQAKGRTAVLLASKHPVTLGDLKLSAYGDTSAKWRAVRAALLTLGRVYPPTPEHALRAMQWLERREPQRLDVYYSLFLDYCFWLGARDALREHPDVRRHLARLNTSLREAQV